MAQISMSKLRRWVQMLESMFRSWLIFLYFVFLVPWIYFFANRLNNYFLIIALGAESKNWSQQNAISINVIKNPIRRWVPHSNCINLIIVPKRNVIGHFWSYVTGIMYAQCIFCMLFVFKEEVLKLKDMKKC